MFGFNFIRLCETKGSSFGLPRIAAKSVALVAVAATPAMARSDHAKADRHQTTRTGIEVMSPLVTEPGEKALAPVPPSLVNRAYIDAVRRDADRQLNRGY